MRFAVKMDESELGDRLDQVLSAYYLSDLTKAAVVSTLRKLCRSENKDSLAAQRLIAWFTAQLNKQRDPAHNPGQRGCPDVYPGLAAQPWW